MQHHNIFSQIHANPASVLFHMRQDLEKTAFQNAEEGLLALMRLEKMLDQLYTHIQQRRLAAKRTGLFFSFPDPVNVKAQLQIESSVSRLYNLVPVYKLSVSSFDKADIGNAIIRAFKELETEYRKWAEITGISETGLAV